MKGQSFLVFVAIISAVLVSLIPYLSYSQTSTFWKNKLEEEILENLYKESFVSVENQIYYPSKYGESLASFLNFMRKRMGTVGKFARAFGVIGFCNISSQKINFTLVNYLGGQKNFSIVFNNTAHYKEVADKGIWHFQDTCLPNQNYTVRIYVDRKEFLASFNTSSSKDSIFTFVEVVLQTEKYKLIKYGRRVYWVNI